MLTVLSNWTFFGANAGQIAVAIITSLIASIVFWFVFDRVPKWFAKKKVQPLIDYDLYQVYMTLFFFLETPFRPSKQTASQFQEELHTGAITQDDFRTFLSTKCLSEEYRKVDEMAKNLLPVGKELQEKAEEITNTITQLYVFNHYLSADQILLCRQILDAINRYSYDMPAFDVVGKGVVLRPVNPTMSFMSEAFYELYGFYRSLQDYLICSKGRTVFKEYRPYLEYTKVHTLFEQNKLKKVVRLTRNTKNNLLESLRLRALYRLKGADAIRPALVTFLRQKHTDLVSWRYGFEEMMNDDVIKPILITERSQEEYDEMARCLEKEAAQKEQYQQFAKEMESYYVEKAKNGGYGTVCFEDTDV